MSAAEHVQEADNLGSRIKLTMNAKRECQIEISVREGTAPATLDEIARMALAKYRELERELAQ